MTSSLWIWETGLRELANVQPQKPGTLIFQEASIFLAGAQQGMMGCFIEVFRTEHQQVKAVSHIPYVPDRPSADKDLGF